MMDCPLRVRHLLFHIRYVRRLPILIHLLIRWSLRHRRYKEYILNDNNTTATQVTSFHNVFILICLSDLKKQHSSLFLRREENTEECWIKMILKRFDFTLLIILLAEFRMLHLTESVHCLYLIPKF